MANPPLFTAKPDLDSDLDHLKVLRKLVGAQWVAMELNAAILNRVDSPLSLLAEDTRWIVLGLIGGGGALIFVGWPLAIGICVLVLVTYFFIGRRRATDALHKRALGALDDSAEWRKLWRYGGVTLNASPAIGVSACAAPDGNWMKFVREILEKER